MQNDCLTYTQTFHKYSIPVRRIVYSGNGLIDIIKYARKLIEDAEINFSKFLRIRKVFHFLLYRLFPPRLQPPPPPPAIPSPLHPPLPHLFLHLLVVIFFYIILYK